MKKPGHYIFDYRKKETLKNKLNRMDFLTHLYILINIFLIIIGLTISSLFFYHGKWDDAAYIALATGAFFTYAYNTHLHRGIRIGEYTSNLMDMLHKRWDEFKNDNELIKLSSKDFGTLTDEEKNKLLHYMYPLFDVFDYALHLLQNGYFGHNTGLAGSYENIFKRTLKNHHIASIWNEIDKNGERYFQIEYSPYLRDIINNIHTDINLNNTLMNPPPNSNREQNNTNEYKGLIIKESLSDCSILDKLTLIDILIENDQNQISSFWHLYKVSVSIDEIFELQRFIKKRGWYAHFWNDKWIIVLYPDSIFKLDVTNKETWSRAIEHGRFLNIPNNQLDFRIY